MGQSFSSFAITVGILLALVVLSGFGILAPVMDAGRLTVNILLTPLVGTLQWVRDFGLAFFAVHDLVSENEYLTAQIATLNTELARSAQATDENQILREAIGFQSKAGMNLIAAEVLSYDYLNLNQKIILNRGAKDGIKVGDNVIASSGILLGIVTDLSSQTSLAELITSSGQAVNARTSPGKVSGIVRGEHGLGLVLEQVSLTEKIDIDDRVVTSGLGGKFIPNLYIGKIGEIRTRSTDLFQTATIVPAADFRDLQFVFIVKGN